MRRYLTLSADYRSTGIRDDYQGELQQSDLNISDQLWERLATWVKAYEKIIPLSPEERKTRHEEIQLLDTEGLELVKEFRRELGPEAKISYYSEGLLVPLYSSHK